MLTDAQTGGPLAGKNLTVTATLQGTTSEFSSSVLVTEGSNVVINPSMDPNTFGTLPYVLDNLIIPSTGLPEVTFNINTNEFPDPTIRPTISQPIPQLTVPITIDGTNVFTNQPVMIQGPGTTVPTPDPCNGPNATAPGIDGFVITFQASGSTLRHLELNGFRDAILIEGASNNTSFNNYLGYILADGTTPGNLRAGASTSAAAPITRWNMIRSGATCSPVCSSTVPEPRATPFTPASSSPMARASWSRTPGERTSSAT